jgi:hypothetical protein
MEQLSGCESILHSTVLLQESYRQAKKRYASQIAPDFRLFRFFNINENTLSQCLAYLLNPDESHAQGDLFLTRFYQLIEKPGTVRADNKLQVSTEYTIAGDRRIDILITDRHELTGIENKPWASDQKDQLHDYAQWLALEAKRRGIGWSLVYLCNNEISEFTLCPSSPEEIKKHIKPVTFYQLESWLSECAWHIKAASVRCFVDALVKFIREDINGETSMDLQDELTEKLTASPQNLSAAFLIAQNMRRVKESLWKDFISYLSLQLSPQGIRVEMNDALRSGGKYAAFQIWFRPGDSFMLAWEFEVTDYRGLAYGICSADEPTKELQKIYYPPIAKAMRQLYPAIDAHEDSEGWWPWWCYADAGMNISRNWSMDPEAWTLLLDRGEDSFAQLVISMARRIHAEMDLPLLRGPD